MISLQEARRIITESLSPLPAKELPLAEALGSVLAAPVLADAWYPSGDRATMDGYVVRSGQEPGEFTVTGEIQAGAIPDRVLGLGEAMRIFTGALVPEGGGLVIPQEMAERNGETVKIPIFPELRFIRTKGSEAQPGGIILPTGARLGPAELAMLAQVGAVAPSVIGRPVVRHIATGGEIVPPEETPPEGKIRDTNTSLLHALLGNQGVQSISSSRCADDPAALVDLCAEPCDLLLISGGASVGDYDFGAEALRRLGFTIHFDKVNLRPGKPLTFATKGSQAAFVIPGNPVSHFVCFHVAIRLAVELMSGIAPSWSFLDLDLHGEAILKPDPRETFWPARAEALSGSLVVSPLRWSTSGDTFSLAGTNALVQVNESSPSGTRVKTLLLAAPL
jgi:molybdopterin molybdotransferase